MPQKRFLGSHICCKRSKYVRNSTSNKIFSRRISHGEFMKLDYAIIMMSEAHYAESISGEKKKKLSNDVC